MVARDRRRAIGGKVQPDCTFRANRRVKPLPVAVFGAPSHGHGAPRPVPPEPARVSAVGCFSLPT